GSELCRQALKQDAMQLIIFENTEFNLYEIEKELQNTAAKLNIETKITPVLGDVCDKQNFERTIKTHSVDTIYHAAAYKHVPMVESNIVEGVRNNVFGTLTAAQSALKCGVQKFVLISTDKAVRPTNVMGASKRVSEMILQALQDSQNNTSTKFTMVRFGNVLDSAGSVVPLFRTQIRNGGPITVTHEDVERFFMTIPEAAQLVLQAGAMAEGGEVFLLDMGEAVKIHDLATRMIRLSGLQVKNHSNPDGDIEIEITGLRPGEKLYEELFITTDIDSTRHPSIMKATEDYLSWTEMSDVCDRLGKLIEGGDDLLIKKLLSELVDGYIFRTPTSQTEPLVNPVAKIAE
ncbi:MAG: UDP-N-acetylglucosamine 4,6-dehydratase family protein, partial [Alphaproteobacteria bacterium]|nr:UDP-N-acetylglucosamine 4,6-dehydratase family protein [Alphaproteobacteria bacterium]